MLRTYAFSGRKRPVLAILLIPFLTLVGVIIWVFSKKISRLSQRPFVSLRRIPDSPRFETTVSPLFMLVNRSGCFSVSDIPSGVALLKSVVGEGFGGVRVPINYHLGVRIRLCFDAFL